MTNVYKVELAIIDHDELGDEEIKKVLEETKYPNYCIYPYVLNIEGRDIGEWDDKLPINNRTTRRQEIDKLFSGWQPISTAPHDGTRILFFYGMQKAVFTAYYDYNYEYTIHDCIVDGSRQDVLIYSYWHLILPNDDESLYFDVDNPVDCYWQPMLELPI